MAVATWLPGFIRRFYRDSRIPQFILDARHPWIEANRSWLERLPNPNNSLCSLESLMRPDATIPEQTCPPDLFHRLEINNNRWKVDRAGWRNAIQRSREMLQCPAALNDVRELDIEIWIHDISSGIRFYESRTPPKEVQDLLTQLLQSMPNLEFLKWETFDAGNDAFKQAFSNASLTLPSVKRLELAQHTEFFVDLCPNLEVLQSSKVSTRSHWRENTQGDPRMPLIEAAGRANNLTSFSLRTDWEPELLEAIVRTMPNLQTLFMEGSLSRYQWSRARWDGDKTILKSFTAILRNLTQLHTLHLPPSSELYLGFDGGAWCGNAYFGPGGRAYGRSVARQSAQTTELAAKIVLQDLPNLQSLWIGGHQAQLTRGEKNDALVEAKWPWTDRLKNWTYEIWPEKEMFPGEDEAEGGMLVGGDEDDYMLVDDELNEDASKRDQTEDEEMELKKLQEEMAI